MLSDLYMQRYSHIRPRMTRSGQRVQGTTRFFTTAPCFMRLCFWLSVWLKHFRDVPEFGPLREILKDRTATEIRNSNLNPLRNQVAFHFSEDAIGGQFMKMDMEP